MKRATKGFTLIEMSIVLVIIGLIVGGILVGQNLIAAAAVRAQITQIEKFQTAKNTFYGKYGYLPGDIPNPYATQFGFLSRGSQQGQGDGNGLIECLPSTFYAYSSDVIWGEQGMFWVDLSQAQLIEGGFNTATPTAQLNGISGSMFNAYLPQTKISSNGYVYVWSGGYQELSNITNGRYMYSPDATNYFGIANVESEGGGGGTTSGPLLTVTQAYNIDKKIDDGMPQLGNVTAIYLGGSGWSAGVGGPTGDSSRTTGGPVFSTPDNNNWGPYGTTSCYDNTKGYPEQYSQQNANNVNCSLSFKFQ